MSVVSLEVSNLSHGLCCDQVKTEGANNRAAATSSRSSLHGGSEDGSEEESDGESSPRHPSPDALRSRVISYPAYHKPSVHAAAGLHLSQDSACNLHFDE